ncbi:tartronate semialdehyde reductase [Anaerococcus lactolyticus S7-1-13]|uniref:Tartronate semialdehyde reductase n=2 Tax=Anaerococcus lactolyticus TaxID=33032 RepID=A0A095X5P8_9FIRM|nr:2-hydroxy-3-oxopropionate reductase [Anaerococcus lactolyticus]KGF05016.1 tartronate semialdehyde reductase [Anaerococcus lactolyticus S7-1-13]
MKIGFVGLGVMGKPMAKNLIKAGYELNVNTLEEEVVKEFEELGAKGYASKKDLAQDSDVIILMLPNSPNCDQAIFGEDSLVDGLSEGKIIVDMSSINPVESKRFAKALEEKGVRFIDAPVSGGEPKAIDGTLAVMVGGDEKTFEEVKPIIEKMASSIVRTGDVGAGNTTKLANQIVVALNIAAVSEAFTLAKKAGVDPEAVYHAIRGGLAGSTVMDAKGPMMLERNFKPGFRIDLHIKDLQNALDTSHSVQASLPLTAGVMEILQALRIDGNEKDDHSAIVKYYEKINNVEVGENK